MARPEETNHANVKDVDHGWSWVVAVSCSFIFLLLWGTNKSTGQLFVGTLETYPAVSRKEAALPYTLALTICFLCGPLAGYLGQRFGVTIVMKIGIILSVSGMALCYFVSDVKWITVFWGLLHGFGFSLTASLIFVCIMRNFVKYRAIAMGMVTLGPGVGFFLPALFDMVLEKYGLHGTFLIMSGLILHCLPAIMLINRPKKHAIKFSTKQNTISENPEVSRIEVLQEIRTSSTNGQSCLGAHCSANEIPYDGSQIPEISCGSHHLVATNTDDISETTNHHLRSNDVMDGRKDVHVVANTEDVSGANHPEPCFQRQNPIPSSKGNIPIWKKFVLIATNKMFILVSISNTVYLFTTVGLMYTIIIDYSLDIGIEHSYAKYPLMSMSLGEIIGRLGCGRMSDAKLLPNPVILVIGFASQSLVSIAIAFATKLWQMNCLMVLYCISGGFCVLPPVLMAHYTSEELMTIAIPSSHLISAPAVALVSLTVGYFRDNIGSYVGIFYTIAGICMMFSLSWLYVSVIEHRTQTKSDVK